MICNPLVEMEYDHHFILALFHVLLVSPLLLFVGFQRALTPEWIFKALFWIGVVIIGFHGYKAFIRFNAHSSYLYVNLMHLLIIGPLLAFIGYHGKDTPRFAYELLLLIGFAALGYHTFGLVRLLNTHSVHMLDKE